MQVTPMMRNLYTLKRYIAPSTCGSLLYIILLTQRPLMIYLKYVKLIHIWASPFAKIRRQYHYYPDFRRTRVSIKLLILVSPSRPSSTVYMHWTHESTAREAQDLHPQSRNDLLFFFFNDVHCIVSFAMANQSRNKTFVASKYVGIRLTPKCVGHHFCVPMNLMCYLSLLLSYVFTQFCRSHCICKIT